MPNPNPVQARLTLRRRRRAGDLADLMKAVWQAVGDAEQALEQAETNDARCKAIHAMSAIATTYTKMLQVGEYEARLALIEKALEEMRRAQP